MTVATFGDMVRVPGTRSSLARERGRGADVRIVYSPLDALRSRRRPDRQVVFLGVGFETTAPAAALLLGPRARPGKILCSRPTRRCRGALRALLDVGRVALDGFILPGHVSVVTGSDCYRFLATEYRCAAS